MESINQSLHPQNLPCQLVFLHILRRTIAARPIAVTFRFPGAAAITTSAERHRVFLVIQAVVVAHHHRL